MLTGKGGCRVAEDLDHYGLCWAVVRHSIKLPVEYHHLCLKQRNTILYWFQSWNTWIMIKHCALWKVVWVEAPLASSCRKLPGHANLVRPEIMFSCLTTLSGCFQISRFYLGLYGISFWGLHLFVKPLWPSSADKRRDMTSGPLNLQLGINWALYWITGGLFGFF